MYSTDNNMDVAVIRIAKIALITVGTAIVIGTSIAKLPEIKGSINFKNNKQNITPVKTVNTVNNNLPVNKSVQTPVVKPTPQPTPKQPQPTPVVNKPITQSNKTQENNQIIKPNNTTQKPNQGQSYTEPKNTQQTDTVQEQPTIHYQYRQSQREVIKYEYQEQPVSTQPEQEQQVVQNQQQQITVQQPIQQTQGQQVQTQQSNGISIGSENPQ